MAAQTRGDAQTREKPIVQIPLPSVSEQREGKVQAIQQRAKVQRDSIIYFPSREPRVLHPFLSRLGNVIMSSTSGPTPA